MFSAIGSDITSGITSGFSKGISGLFGNLFGGSEPEPETAQESADRSKTMMDTLYPGTNAWERLGSSGGAAATGGGSQQSAAKLQSDTQLKVAKIQSDASRYAVDASTMPRNVEARLKSRKTPYEIKNLRSQTELYGNQSFESVQRRLTDISKSSDLSASARLKNAEAVLKEAIDPQQYADQMTSGNFRQQFDKLMKIVGRWSSTSYEKIGGYKGKADAAINKALKDFFRAVSNDSVTSDNPSP